MTLTNAQMRAIELNLEQMERLMDLAHHRRAKGTPMDLIVREFYEGDDRGSKFEMDILNKIGALLVPESDEPLTYSVIFNSKN